MKNKNEIEDMHTHAGSENGIDIMTVMKEVIRVFMFPFVNLHHAVWTFHALVSTLSANNLTININKRLFTGLVPLVNFHY